MYKDRAITVRFTPQDIELIEKYAMQDNRPVANFIYHIVLRYVQEQENRKEKNYEQHSGF
ncbi:MAG: hypothetical protein IJ597_07745 [Synergistaceae bacterium]|nr:hypothetical protein [Synergistaceae bacterium]